MTPPTSSTASGVGPQLPIDVSTDVHEAIMTAERPALTPAPRAQAVLVPPVALALAATIGVGALEHAYAGTRGLRLLLDTLVITFLVLLPNAVILTWARAHGSRAGFLVAPAVGVVFAAVGAGLMPGPQAHPIALGGACLLGFLAPLLWRPWQDRWMEKRVERVSLLAPSVLAAADAIERLEVVPWIRVLSVLVPEGDAEVAGRLLKRPVARAPRGGPRLERRVIVSCPMRDPAVGRSIAELVARGHDLTSESATLRRAEGRIDVGRADPLNILLGRPRSRWMDTASRILDIVGSLLLLVLFSPLLLVTSIAVVLSSGFPVFYKQLRVGRGGRPFHVVKFRSMRKDAEKLSGPVWATEEDPRITPVGRFLRRYRLDELPQLFNVLLGQMALVGPRPERPHFCDVLREQVPLFELRTIVRPGLTGWAQVRLAYGASSDDAAAKLSYDLYYVAHRSPWFDLAILVETARVVLTGAGSR